MTMRLAYAALAVTALAGSAALAQQANDTSQQPAAQAAGQFIEKQTVNEWRAPKLIGVSVYGSDNQKVGKINDILTNHDGKAEAVVIGIGGFLGIGTKAVTLPFEAVHWRTEGRVVASEPRPPSTGALGSSGGQ
ncbi:MAG TPA: PRC-barrel domain-containing protein [Roseiarcus sp.]|nr:PRC-barrel domain-containing protein [Roseiarcus sp.]